MMCTSRLCASAEVAAATVARAAMDEGVARASVDLEEYPRRLAVRRKHCRRACRLGCGVPA